MNLWNHYLTPQTVQDAVRALSEAPGMARLVAGGTDLLLEIQQGHHERVDTLVDVNQIPELQTLETRQEQLFIGAAVPLTKIASSPLVKEHAEALVEAAGLVGGPQVRNTATLGGNVSHALPAADGAIALSALNVQAEVASPSGRRFVQLADLFVGPGKSALHPQQDLLVGFHTPLRHSGQSSAFSRVMRPQGVALPVLNMSIWLERGGDRILDVRIAIGPAGPVPHRNQAAERALKGQVYCPEAIETAAAAILESARFRTSPQRATADYRKHLSGVLLREVLQKAWQRAGL